MKRLFNLLLTLVLVATAMAGTVKRQQAREAAAKFMAQKGMQMDESSQRGSKAPAADQPLYVFNAADGGGFVVVSGDDRTNAILGYTKQGSYDEDNLPPALKEWFSQMAAEIEALGDDVAEARAAEEAETEIQRVPIHPEIKPLIATTWNQGNTDNVYNAKCPVVSGKHCLTGCVATAGAQIMYYHKWPKELTAEVPGYTTQGSSANTSKALPPTQFKWDLMKTSYSLDDPDTDAVNAVAELMVYCGYAAKMKYGLGGSSASESVLAKGMAEYFGYDPNTLKDVSREEYSVLEWDWLIYNELANRRPVIYSGSSSVEGGHAFICDGYSEDGLYHINWGWGGGYNGYFQLAGTNPYRDKTNQGYGFILNHSCVIGLQPDTGIVPEDPNAPDEWEEPVVEGLVATARKASLDGTVISTYMQNGNDQTCYMSLSIGELLEDGTIVPFDTEKYKYFQNSSLGSGSYFVSPMTFDVSSYGLSEGKHVLVPISQLSGETEWKRCRPASLWYEVDSDGDGGVTVVQHPIIDLKFNEFNLISDGSPGVRQGVRLSITNDGDNYESNFYLYVDGVYCYERIPLKIASGHTKEYRLSTSVLNEGTHTLTLRNGYEGDVIIEKEINISLDLATTQFTAPQGKFAGTPQPFDVTVESHAGDFNGLLYFHASKNSSNVGYSYVAGAAIPEGGSSDVRFYFTPTSGGDWNIWLTTDEAGQNRIGQGIVHIEDAPSGTVTLQRVSSTWTPLPNGLAEYKVTYKNTSETTYYRDVRVYLYRKPETGNSWPYHGTDTSAPIVLEPEQEITLTFNFTKLEDGTVYGIYPQYYSTYTSTNYSNLYQYANTETYTYNAPAAEDSVPGDTSGDGLLTAEDVTPLIEFLTGKRSEAPVNADANVDEKVDITDIVTLISKIIQQQSQE